MALQPSRARYGNVRTVIYAKPLYHLIIPSCLQSSRTFRPRFYSHTNAPSRFFLEVYILQYGTFDESYTADFLPSFLSSLYLYNQMIVTTTYLTLGWNKTVWKAYFLHYDFLCIFLSLAFFLKHFETVFHTFQRLK